MNYWKRCKVAKFLFKNEVVVKLTAVDDGKQVDTTNWKWLYLPEVTYNTLISADSIDALRGVLAPDILGFLETGPFNTSALDSVETEFVQKVFVTNAVANSVAYYAWVYLLNMRLTGRQIIDLRKKYSLTNICTDQISQKELLASFVNQSAFFLNLVTHMHQDDRFLIAAQAMGDENFKKYFKGYSTPEELFKRYYDRRIYHRLLECDYMRKNYEEGDEYHRNTRVFAEKKFANPHEFNAGGYLVSGEYLESLDMRICKKCADPKNFLLDSGVAYWRIPSE